MSYGYSTKMPKTLRQPITLAVLGSLGIHGLLWAILPILPLASKPSAVQQQPTVGLVKLTPAEQERLPQLTPPPLAKKQVDNSQLTLPESSVPPPLPPEASVLPPLPPPLPPEASVLPPLPPPLPPETSVLPPLPPLPNTGSSAHSSIIYPPLANLKPKLAVPAPPPSSLLSPSTLPQQQNIKPSPLPTNLSKIPQPKLPHRELLPPPPSFSPPVNTGLPSLVGIKPAPFSPPPATALKPLPERNQSQKQQTAVAISKSATPTQPENSSTLGRQELLADLEKYRRNIDRRELLANLEKYQAQSQRTTTATTRKETPTTEQQQITAQQPPTTPGDRSEQPTPLSDNPTSSTLLAARNAEIADYAAWRNRIKQEQPESARQILVTINVCQKQLDGSNTRAEVVVNPQGKITDGPKIVGQVIPSVQRDTERFLTHYSFSKTEKSTIYPFGITYKYSPTSCSEANIKPTTDRTNNRQPTSENSKPNNSQPTTEQTNNRQSTSELLPSRKRHSHRLQKKELGAKS